MAGKSFSFGFAIGASVAPSLNGAFTKINGNFYKLNGAMMDLEKTQSRLQNAFRKGIINENTLKEWTGRVESYRNKLSRVNAGEVFNKATFDFGAAYIAARNATGFLASPVQSAMKFESVMADVRKVVDFDTPQQFKQMNNDILELSKRIPMTAEGLGRIVAAGGQSGIAREDLTAFAEAAAKMGVAFDITADQAGDMMAKWRTAFKMNQGDVEALADKINYLGNTTAASATLISDVVTRIGPLGEVGGVASGEIAALGASMVGSGIQSEVAATGIKNMILAMSSGESATNSQKEAFARLGMTTTDLAQRMQTDAKGAIMDVLQSISQLDKSEQASVLQNIFGKESLGAIAPLLSNLDGLRDNFNKVGDASKYAGSMQNEFDTRSQTTENSVQLLQNRMEAAQIAIGTGILPVVTTFAEIIGKVASAIGNFATKFPVLTQVIIGLGIATITVVTAIRMLQAIVSACSAVNMAWATVTKGATFATMVQSAATKIAAGALRVWSTAQWMVNAAMAACPFFLILAGCALLAGAIVWVINNWETVKEWFITLWNDPAKALQEFIDGVTERFKAVIDWLGEKWNALKSIFSSPVSGNINVTATENGGEIAHNASGGIYRKGAFLTTFAENSAEAAIPLDGSSRAVSLWTQAGESLGVLQRASGGMGAGGNQIAVNFQPQVTIQGNADAGSVEHAMTLTLKQLKRMLQDLEHQRGRLAYD